MISRSEAWKHNVNRYLESLKLSYISLGAAQRLMDHNSRVGQGSSFALGSSRQKERSHGGRHTEADGVHVTGDVLHGVEDRESGLNRASGTVDVDGDVFLRVGRCEVQHLADHHVGDVVVDLGAEHEDPVLQQPREHVGLVLPQPHGGERQRRSLSLGRLLRLRSRWGRLGHHVEASLERRGLADEKQDERWEHGRSFPLP